MRAILCGLLAAVFGLAASAQTNCNQMPITIEFINSSEANSNSYDHMMCDSDFKTSEDASNAGIGLGALVYGVPLQLNTSFSKTQKDEWKHQHCEGTHSTSQYAKSYQALIRLVSPEAYKAWSDCQLRNAYGLVCWMEQPADENYEVLTLRTRWNPLPGDTGRKPSVLDSALVGARRENGKRTAFTKGTDLSTGPTATLLRQPKGVTVVAVVNSNRGSCPAYAAPKPQKPNYCAADPVTKQPYHREFSEQPSKHLGNPHVVRGGDDKTPGTEMKFDEELPGPVYAVSYRLTGGYERIDSCSFQGNIAHCEGWINGGDATVVMIVDWRQVCQPPEKVEASR